VAGLILSKQSFSFKFLSAKRGWLHVFLWTPKFVLRND